MLSAKNYAQGSLRAGFKRAKSSVTKTIRGEHKRTLICRRSIRALASQENEGFACLDKDRLSFSAPNLPQKHGKNSEFCTTLGHSCPRPPRAGAQAVELPMLGARRLIGCNTCHCGDHREKQIPIDKVLIESRPRITAYPVGAHPAWQLDSAAPPLSEAETTVSQE